MPCVLPRRHVRPPSGCFQAGVRGLRRLPDKWYLQPSWLEWYLLRGRLEPRQQWLLCSHQRVPSVPVHVGCELEWRHHMHVQCLRWGICHN